MSPTSTYPTNLPLIGPLPKGNSFGFIDWKGAWVVEVRCDHLGDFQEGLAPFLREGKIGFINKAGVEVIPPRFSTDAIVLPGFREGLAPVFVGDLATYINTEGEIVLPPRSNCTLWNFMDGKALTGSAERGYAIIDREWNELSILPVRDIPFHFNFPDNWNSIPCLAGDRGDCETLIDWKGSFVFPPIYSRLGYFHEGVAPFSPTGDRYGLIRINGEIIVEPKFLQFSNFSERIAAAQIEKNKWGFIDASGEWVIEPAFLQALPFREGLACVSIRGNDGRSAKGFINRSGEMVFPPRYSRQASFQNGWALVESEGRMQVINKQGSLIWEG